MPDKILSSEIPCYMTYIFAGGIGMFFQDLMIKIVITTVALTFASRFVYRYKEWNEKNPHIKSEFKRFILFIKAGFVKAYDENCIDEEKNKKD